MAIDQDTGARGLTLRYVWAAISLWVLGRIRWRTLKRALRDRPPAVSGIGCVYFVDAAAEENFFGGER